MDVINTVLAQLKQDTFYWFKLKAGFDDNEINYGQIRNYGETQLAMYQYKDLKLTGAAWIAYLDLSSIKEVTPEELIILQLESL